MNPILRLDSVSKAFGGVVASDRVSFSVMPGEIHGLIGPNGAGKSTLMNQISGIYTPDSGRIFLNEKDITCVDSLRISLFERAVSGAEEKEQSKTILQLTRYLQEHLAEELSLQILADAFHLSALYISQLFKSEIGVNFLSYLTNIRMERAKKLLVSTDLPIAEVSQKAGYPDYRVFTKAFKKAEGVTPSQYRRDF